MRGDQVIIRAFNNKALVKKVWAVGAGRVYVTSDAVFEKLSAGKTDLIAIGYSAEDVFKYDADIARNLDGNVEWSKLKRYQ